MSDDELARLLAAERDALERYARIKVHFIGKSDVVECARLIWEEATAELIEYQAAHGG